MRQATYGGRLAVRTGDGNYGNSPAFAGRKQRVNNRFTDGTRFAARRRYVHAKPRRGVDFDNSPAALFQWLIDTRRNDIDASDVEAHQLYRFDHACQHLRCHFVRHVRRRPSSAQVGIASQSNDLAWGWHRFSRQTLFLKHFLANVIE